MSVGGVNNQSTTAYTSTDYNTKTGGTGSGGGSGKINYPVTAEDLEKIIDKAIAQQTAEAMNKALGGLSKDDISKLDLMSLMFAVMSERANQLDEQVRTMAAEMQARNNEMKEANQMLAMARQIAAAVKDGESADMPDSMRIYFAQHGIETAGLSTDPSSSTATFSLTDTEKTGSKVKTIEANIAKLDDAITKGDSALSSVKNMPYADNCAIKRDLPQDAINFAKAHGIPIPNGDGKSLKKDQIDSFKSAIENKVNSLKSEKTKQTGDLAQAQKDHVTAEKNVAADKKAEEGRVKEEDLNITGGYKPSDITISQTKDQWQANIENLKGHLEGLNNQSQLDMIKFQSLMSKYTAQTEALSNVMKKLGDNIASLIGNLR